jgi:hypothetical protein
MKERDLLEELRVDGMLMLNWILKEIVGRLWTEIMRFGIRINVGSYINGSELSIKLHKLRGMYIYTQL